VTDCEPLLAAREELPPADEGGMMEEAAPGEGALLDPSTLKKEEGHGKQGCNRGQDHDTSKHTKYSDIGHVNCGRREYWAASFNR
jgi:hypothetical protein